MTALTFAAAAAVGTVVRWQVGTTLSRPLGTLLVNIIGAFALGLLQGTGSHTLTVLGVGGLGALTTFSTVATELTEMWATDRVRAVSYGVITLVGGVAAAWVGLTLA